MGIIIKKYLWVIDLLAILITTFLLAKLSTLLIAGQFPDQVITANAGSTQKALAIQQAQKPVDLDAILKRNFFDPDETIVQATDTEQPQTPEVTPEANDDPNGVAVKTSLDIKLLSTVSVGDGRNALCSSVIDSHGKPGVYFVAGKDTFETNAKITRILSKRVEFLNSGKLEYVELEDPFGNKVATKADRPTSVKKIKKDDEPESDIKSDGDKFTIPRAEVDKALADFNQLFTAIRAVPYFKEGKANGLKLLSVKGGSLFDKLGLKRGDILKAINGNTLDIQSGLQLFNQLKGESAFTLDVERRGADKTLSYEII